MFKFPFFGPGNTAGATTLEVIADKVADTFSPRPTADIIAEIHHSFYTAGDKLLADAHAIISGTSEDSFAKAERLRKLGFSASKEVTEVAAKKAELAKSKSMQQMLVDYALRYPTYRFIDEAGIEAICKKYNLVFGNISDYKGFVPEKNLKEIENFPGVKEQDATYQKRAVFGPGRYGDWRHDEEATPGYQERMTRLMQDPRYAHQMHMMNWGGRQTYEHRNSKNLLICAPVKDMKMDGKELDGHKVIAKHIPDPVVLAPMKGGLYCILTAWGDEASDPLVEKQNLN